MLFNSYEFPIFFTIVYSLYRILGDRYRLQNLLLLVAAAVFYGWWDLRFLYLIVLSTGLDYSTGLLIGRGSMPWKQRLAVTAWLGFAAVAFLAINWGAVDLGLRPVRLSVNWSSLWSTDRAIWLAIGFSSAVVLLAHLAYPLMMRLDDEPRRRAALTLAIVANLGLLGFFKYFNFFADSFSLLWKSVFGVHPDLFTVRIILPVGISFYTFQSMAYTIDLYRKKLQPSENLLEYAAYVSFFPQLVAGPIERPAHLLSQFQAPRPRVDGPGVADAMWLIVWGLFKKMVVADNMAVIVNEAFGPFDGLASQAIVPTDGVRLLFALYAFALQIYGDFSGYTDIARGTAKLLGFELMLNFNLPYFAISPSDFWRRWHISLSTWLRDYLYISLGGNRFGSLLTYRNLFLTMLLGGLWHGAAWPFIFWGVYHGTLLIVYRLIGLGGEDRHRSLLVNLLMGLVMFHLTCLGWLLFRAQNMTTVRIFLESIFFHFQTSPEAWKALGQVAFHGWFLIAFQLVQLATGSLNPMPKFHWFLRLNIWIFVIMELLRQTPHTSREFIYFAF
jgi:alginate O-acetyltransferase complex protein AlgI